MVNQDKTESIKRHSKVLLVLFTTLFLMIHISGDHVFNNTNTLKMVLLAIAVTTLCLYKLTASSLYPQHRLSILLFLASPILATFPGLTLTAGQYSYSTPIELTSQTLCVLWAYLLFVLFSQTNNINQIIWCLIPTIAFVCLIAIAERMGLSPLMRLYINPFEASAIDTPVIYFGLVERVKSTFGNINYFSGFLIQLIPIALFLVITTWSKQFYKNKYQFMQFIAALVILLIMILSLKFAGTRAAIAACMTSLMVFGIIYFFLIKRTSVRNLSIVIALLTISIVSTFFSDPQLISRFSSLWENGAWASRTIAWQAAWNSVVEAPWFGYGIGSSYQLFFEFVSADSRLWSNERSFNHAHFEMLEVLQEGGILGLIAYIFMWGTLFIYGFSVVINRNYDTQTRTLALAILCGLIAYHIHGFFSIAPRMIATRMVTYTLLALLLILITHHTRFGQLFRKKQKQTIVSIALLAALLTAVWIQLIPFAQTQYQYVKALANPEDQFLLTSIEENTSDVHVLNEASHRAAKIGDGGNLQRIAEKLATIFPNFRMTGYYLAYSYYLEGDFDKSMSLAQSVQLRDRYLPEVNILLLKLAYELNNPSLFQDQLAIAVKLLGCKNKLFNCDKTSINVLSKTLTSPIQFRLNEHKFDILVDLDFFELLRSQYLTASNSKPPNPKLLVASLVKLIGTDDFFSPKSINSSIHLETSDIQTLTQYLRILNQLEAHDARYKEEYLSKLSAHTPLEEQRKIFFYNKQLESDHKRQLIAQASPLEKKLRKELKLEEFIKARKFLISFSTFLAQGNISLGQ